MEEDSERGGEYVVPDAFVFDAAASEAVLVDEEVEDVGGGGGAPK